jgi:hypothetical protein
MSARTSATVEQLRIAFERSSWRGRITFYDACTQRWSRTVLELGAAMVRKPTRRPVDFKRLQAGDIDDA